MKTFNVPKLNKKQWDELQNYLHDLRNIKNDIEKLKSDFNSTIDTQLEKISITLGLIDSVLGRTYTPDEVITEIRKKFKKLYEKHIDK